MLCLGRMMQRMMQMIHAPDKSELQVPDVQKTVPSQNPEVSLKHTRKQEKLLLALLPVPCKKEKKSCDNAKVRGPTWKVKGNKTKII